MSNCNEYTLAACLNEILTLRQALKFRSCKRVGVSSNCVQEKTKSLNIKTRKICSQLIKTVFCDLLLLVQIFAAAKWLHMGEFLTRVSTKCQQRWRAELRADNSKLVSNYTRLGFYYLSIIKSPKIVFRFLFLCAFWPCVPRKRTSHRIQWERSKCKGAQEKSFHTHFLPFLVFSLFMHVFFTSFSFAVVTKQLALSSNVTTMVTCERKLSTFTMFFAVVQDQNYEVQRCTILKLLWIFLNFKFDVWSLSFFFGNRVRYCCQ